MSNPDAQDLVAAVIQRVYQDGTQTVLDRRCAREIVDALLAAGWCVNTHYGVIAFSGDPFGEHPDPDLNGRPPRLEFIAAGSEEFCWESLRQWTSKHPLRMWENAEVLARDPSVVRDETERARRPDTPA